MRPKQSLFICHTCGYRCNADKKGAINIARRLIRLIPSLRDENGLERWLFPREREQAGLKARRRARPSDVKSERSQGLSGPTGPSAAECYEQSSLVDFANVSDPAVERTVEQPTAAMDARKAADSHGIRLQRSETTSSHALDNARAHGSGEVSALAGDGSHERGGTRELKIIERVHSHSGD